MRTSVSILVAATALVAGCGDGGSDALGESGPVAPATTTGSVPAPQVDTAFDVDVFCATALDDVEETFLDDAMSDAEVLATMRFAAEHFARVQAVAPPEYREDFGAVSRNFTLFADAFESGGVGRSVDDVDAIAAQLGLNVEATERTSQSLLEHCSEYLD